MSRTIYFIDNYFQVRTPAASYEIIVRYVDSHSYDRKEYIMKNIFISMGFKLRFVIKFCMFTLLGGLLFSGLILYSCRDSMITSFEGGRLVIKEAYLSIFPQILYMNLTMLVLAAIMTLLLTFYLFTKICLPFSRIRSDILAIAQGDLTRKIGYRPDDLSSNMGENLNLMTTAFNSKLHDIEGEFIKIINLFSHKQLPDHIALKLIRLHSSIKKDFIL